MKLKLLIATFLLSTNLFAQIKIEKEFTGVEKIDMTTGSGDCILKKSTGDKVTVVLEHYYDKDDYNPTIEMRGSTLKISERSTRGYNDRAPKWTISVPDKLDVKISTGSGDLMVSNLDLELSLSSGSGDITFEDLKGEMKINTGSGDLTVNQLDGTVRVNTGSGTMKVKNAKGEVKLNAGSGDITLEDVEGGIFANVGSGDIDVTNLIVTDESGFNSGSGNVAVNLGSTPKADLMANSGSGDANIGFNGNKMVGELVMEADKKRGEISAPFEFDSSEEVDQGHNTKIVKTKKFDSSEIKIKIGTGSGKAAISK